MGSTRRRRPRLPATRHGTPPPKWRAPHEPRLCCAPRRDGPTKATPSGRGVPDTRSTSRRESYPANRRRSYQTSDQRAARDNSSIVGMSRAIDSGTFSLDAVARATGDDGRTRCIRSLGDHHLATRNFAVQKSRARGYHSTLRRSGMLVLEDVAVGAAVEGIVPGKTVSVLAVRWHGSSSATVVYRMT